MFKYKYGRRMKCAEKKKEREEEEEEEEGVGRNDVSCDKTGL